MSNCDNATGFAFDSPHTAVDALTQRLARVMTEGVPLAHAAGRVLAAPVDADRDSPPHDVSAMDGYAIRLSDIEIYDELLPIAGEVRIGTPAPVLPARQCLQIDTGACVPIGADAVIPREQAEIIDGRLRHAGNTLIVRGQHIRVHGENTRAGQPVLQPGQSITPTVAATLATFGIDPIPVYRKVRVSVLTTGDELLPVASQPEPWQIRDSNGPTLRAGLAIRPWVELVSVSHAADNPATLQQALSEAAASTDLVITTGGVSMGAHDYIRPATEAIGGEVVYHRLPMRPGKPNLGAVLPNGVALLGLPGNPMAVSVGLSVIVAPVLRHLAGFSQAKAHRPAVTLDAPPTKTLPLWRYLPIRMTGDGQASLLPNRGSGDLAGPAMADGLIEIPPGETAAGPWPLYDVRT